VGPFNLGIRREFRSQRYGGTTSTAGYNLEIRREFRSQRYGGTPSTAGSRVVVITGGAFAGTHTGPIILNW